MDERVEAYKGNVIGAYGCLALGYLHSIFLYFPLIWVGTHKTEAARNFFLSFIVGALVFFIAGKLAYGLRRAEDDSPSISAYIGVFLASVGVPWTMVSHYFFYLLSQSV